MSAVIPRYTDRLQNSSDFYMEVARGSFADMELVMVFGHNDLVPNGTWEVVNDIHSVTPFFPAAVTTVRVKAGGNAADAAAGNGARTIIIYGVNSSLVRDSEVITLNADGTLASASTSTSWWRVDRAEVVTCGIYATPKNTGRIVIEDTAGTGEFVSIDAGEGHSHNSVFAVPLGVTAHIKAINVTVDALKAADLQLWTRENFNVVTAPVSPQKIQHIFDGVLGVANYVPLGPDASIVGPADIWMDARGAGVGTEVTAEFELLCIDDEDVTITTSN